MSACLIPLHEVSADAPPVARVQMSEKRRALDIATANVEGPRHKSCKLIAIQGDLDQVVYATDKDCEIATQQRLSLGFRKARARVVRIAGLDKMAVTDGRKADGVLVIARVPPLEAFDEIDAHLIHALLAATGRIRRWVRRGGKSAFHAALNVCRPRAIARVERSTRAAAFALVLAHAGLAVDLARLPRRAWGIRWRWRARWAWPTLDTALHIVASGADPRIECSSTARIRRFIQARADALPWNSAWGNNAADEASKYEQADQQ